DMGLVSGTRIKVIRNAPLMDPFDISLRGYSLALRRSNAKGIEIKLL
ncbi:FeoA domain-containing protein, partial [bacterium]|nr:FeoA domain-containing protein [bacterium]